MEIKSKHAKPSTRIIWPTGRVLKADPLLRQIVGLTVPQKAEDEEEKNETWSQASPALQVTTKQAALWGFACAGAIK